MLAESRPLVLDVRNNYEWDAGHFEASAPQAAGSLAQLVMAMARAVVVVMVAMCLT